MAFCAACFRVEAVTDKWRALHIDSDGDLLMTRPAAGGVLDYERPATVFACGEGTALALVERYLHSGTFDIAHELHLNAPEIPGPTEASTL